MSRYDRQMILPEVGNAGQELLAAAHVLIVGAGGLAATILPTLAGAGIGRIRLIDGDNVSESNLHRQTLFHARDIGLPKVNCAMRYIQQLNSDVIVEPIRQWLEPQNVYCLLQGVDLVIDAADSFAVSYILSDSCKMQKRPLISASVLGRSGYVGGFCGNGPCLRSVFPDLPGRAQSCSSAGVMGPAVAVIGALQAQMAMSVLLDLTPSPIGQMINVDLVNWRFSHFRFDNALTIESALPFISRCELRDADCVIDLRSVTEAPTAVTAAAIRLDVAEVGNWQPPRGQRVVLCCRSGLRAWKAARIVAKQGHRDLALMALGDSNVLPPA